MTAAQVHSKYNKMLANIINVGNNSQRLNLYILYYGNAIFAIHFNLQKAQQVKTLATNRAETDYDTSTVN